MRKVLAAIFNFVAKLIAAVFAILFVVVTILVLLLINVDRTMLNAETYKRALVDEKIYERFPVLVAEETGALKTFLSNPCAENPLACKIDGASAELQACLTEALGAEAYESIGTGQRNPTEAELQLAQPCLDQYGGGPPDENPLSTASPEVQACVKQAVGEEVYETLATGQRPPTGAETRQVAQCFEQAGGDSSGPGVGDGQMAFMNNLTQNDWETLISILLPPDDLQKMTEDALDQVFAYLNGDVDSAKVSLVALKERLTSQVGLDIIKLLLTAQPPCTEEQLAQMTAGLSGGEGDVVLCDPPEEKLAALMPEMQKQLNAAVARIPDQAVIIQPLSPAAQTTGRGPFDQDPLTAFRNIRLGLRLSPLLPLGLLLLVTLFGVRSLKGWLRWWGIPMFIAGLIAFGIGLAALPALDWAWVTYVAVKIPPYLSSSLSEIGHGLANSVVRELAKWIMLEAGAVVLLGLAAIVGSFFVKTKSKEAAPLETVSSSR